MVGQYKNIYQYKNIFSKNHAVDAAVQYNHTF